MNAYDNWNDLQPYRQGTKISIQPWKKKETDWKEENFLPLQPKNDVWSDVNTNKHKRRHEEDTEDDDNLIFIT